MDQRKKKYKKKMTNYYNMNSNLFNQVKHYLDGRIFHRQTKDGMTLVKTKSKHVIGVLDEVMKRAAPEHIEHWMADESDDEKKYDSHG